MAEQGESAGTNWSRLRGYIEEAPSQLADLRRRLRQFANDRPAVASLAAFAGGFLVARALARH